MHKFATAEIELQEVIDEFKDLFLTIDTYNNDPDFPFLSDSELIDAHESCGLDYLKLVYTQTAKKPGNAIKNAITEFKKVISYRKKNIQCNSSIEEWEEIKRWIEVCIDKYELGAHQKKPSEEWFKDLIYDFFGHTLYSMASAKTIKKIILDLGYEIDKYEFEILFYYARFFEYRGCLHLRGVEANNCRKTKKNRLFHAQNDFMRSLNLYDLIKNEDIDKYVKNIKNRLNFIDSSYLMRKNDLLNFFNKFLVKTIGFIFSKLLSFFGYIQIASVSFGDQVRRLPLSKSMLTIEKLADFLGIDIKRNK